MKATWNRKVIAQSDETVIIEGNHYFPPSSIDKSLLSRSELVTTCSWKGDASYYTLTDNDVSVEDAAWYYDSPLPNSITRVGKDYTGYVAFYANIVDISV